MIEHDIEEVSNVVGEQFGNQIVIRYYSDMLIYVSLCSIEDSERRYRQGVMSVGVKVFQIYVVRMWNEVKTE